MSDDPYIDRNLPHMEDDDPAWVSDGEYKAAAAKAQDDYSAQMRAADHREAESLRRQAEHVSDDQVRADLLARAAALMIAAR